MTRRVAAACGLLAGLSAAAVAAPGDIYVVDDGRGGIRLTDRPEGVSEKAEKIVSAAPVGHGSTGAATPGRRPPTGSARTRPGVDPSIDVEVQAAGQAWGVPAELLHAVIAVESNYSPRAVSPRGALGLMQLMPATAHALGVADPFDVRQNIDGGARLLRQLSDRLGGDLELVLAAYNAGEGSVDRYGRRLPPFAETRAYVPRVLGQLRGANSR